MEIVSICAAFIVRLVIHTANEYFIQLENIE